MTARGARAGQRLGWHVGPFLSCLFAAACAMPAARLETPVAPCGALRAFAPAVQWVGSMDDSEVRHRSQWCEPVGPVAYGTAAGSSVETPRGDLLVVSWNVAVGAGDVERLVRLLSDREREAGRAEPLFVLLLQEAYRAGSDVPARYSSAARIPRRIAPAAAEERDVEALAAKLRMHYVYVPSMRNGVVPGHPGEDRGNAILSSLPLHDIVAIELPVEHQRRVAVTATLDVRGLPVTVASVHLDTRRPLLRGSIFSGPLARKRQAAALLEALGGDRIIVGGDFNTLAGPREPAIRAMEERFARVSCGSGPTHQSGLSLDYLFTTDRSLIQDCRRVPDRLHSDHHPLVARVL